MAGWGVGAVTRVIGGRRIHWLLSSLLAASACSASKPPPVRNTVAADGAGTGAAGAPSDPAAVIDAAPICEASNPFCSMSPVVSMSTSVIPTETTCGATPLDLTPAGVNIMLAVDGSAAMAKHWSDIATAIRSLREANPTAAFGLHVFGATRFRWRTLTKR